MRQKLILFYLSFLANMFICSYGQSSTYEQKKMPNSICISFAKIIEVSLCDTSIINEIVNYVLDVKKKDSAFRTSGYLKLVFKKRFQEANATFSNCFSLSVSYYYFNEKDSVSKFPIFYTTIKDKLVLIYDDRVNNLGLTKKNKKEFSKLVNKRLPKQTFLEFRNADGKKVKLSPVGNIVIDCEKEFCY
ncbi:MAG: hypothetical protein ACK4HE_11740 [Chitinophagaceae bacterium]